MELSLYEYGHIVNDGQLINSTNSFEDCEIVPCEQPLIKVVHHYNRLIGLTQAGDLIPVEPGDDGITTHSEVKQVDQTFEFDTSMLLTLHTDGTVKLLEGDNLELSKIVLTDVVHLSLIVCTSDMIDNAYLAITKDGSYFIIHGATPPIEVTMERPSLDQIKSIYNSVITTIDGRVYRFNLNPIRTGDLVLEMMGGDHPLTGLVADRVAIVSDRIQLLEYLVPADVSSVSPLLDSTGILVINNVNQMLKCYPLDYRKEPKLINRLNRNLDVIKPVRFVNVSSNSLAYYLSMNGDINEMDDRYRTLSSVLPHD